MKTLKQGDVVPNFSAKDEQGHTVSLSDYKGKKLVVFFNLGFVPPFGRRFRAFLAGTSLSFQKTRHSAEV